MHARRRISLNLAGLGFFAVLAIVWEVVANTAFSGYDTIAPTSAMLGAVVTLLDHGELLGQIAHTLGVAIVGWLAASALGLALGLMMGLSRRAWTWGMASIEVLRAIPSISFVPVVLLVFGFSSVMELVVVVYVSQWPVLMGALGGVRGVDRGLMDAARTLRLGRWRTTVSIVLPAAFPSVAVGLRLALALSIALAVVAEMLGNPSGLGFGMVLSQKAFHADEVFAYLLVIGTLGWALNAVFVSAVRRLAPGFRSAL